MLSIDTETYWGVRHQFTHRQYNYAIYSRKYRKLQEIQLLIEMAMA